MNPVPPPLPPPPMPPYWGGPPPGWAYYPYPPPPLPPPPERLTGPGDSRGGTVVAWAVILLCVGLVVTRTTDHYRRKAAAGAKANVGGVMLTINARTTVGAQAFTSSLGAGQGFNPAAQVASFDELVNDQEADADDRLRAVMVIGKVLDAKQAQSRLDRLVPTLDLPEFQQDIAALRTVYDHGPDALSADDADRLVQRHGWFARLALATGRPAGDPIRRAAEAPALRAFAAVMAIGLGGIAAFLAGMVLGILALVRYFDGKLRLAYVPPASGTGPFLESFALYLAGILGLSLLIGTFWPRPPIWANLLLGVAVLLAVAWVRLRGVEPNHFRKGFGWHAGQGWLRELGAGIVGYLCALPLMALGLLVTVLLQSQTGIQPTHPAQDMAAGPWARVLQLYVLAAVFAPITEELMFRGAFYHHLRRHLDWPVAALVCGLVFASIHPQGWVGAPPLIALGFAFACVREWRGSTLAPMVAHACNNFVTVSLIVLMTR